jgi:hypothetical protein
MAMVTAQAGRAVQVTRYGLADSAGRHPPAISAGPASAPGTNSPSADVQRLRPAVLLSASDVPWTASRCLWSRPTTATELVYATRSRPALTQGVEMMDKIFG